MPSLRLLLADHPALLLIDSASARIQVGLWTNGTSSASQWCTSHTEAGTGVFDCVENLLNKNGLRIVDIGAFVFCEGPGSVLGIRTVAVALRSWRVINPNAKILCYQSLDLVARALNQPDLRVIADARRDTWHVAQLGRILKRVPTAELSGDAVMPEHFRHWTALPASVSATPYDVAKLFEQLPDADILRTSDAPDAFLHEDPSYVTWTPQIHRSPSSVG
jgi:tRNA threonylcarbamoyladenosine biosynthesis protein TsaB